MIPTHNSNSHLQYSNMWRRHISIIFGSRANLYRKCTILFNNKKCEDSIGILNVPKCWAYFFRANFEPSYSINCSFSGNSRYHRLPELLIDVLLSTPSFPSCPPLRLYSLSRPRNHAVLVILFSSPAFLSLSSSWLCHFLYRNNPCQFLISYSRYYFATQSANLCCDYQSNISCTKVRVTRPVFFFVIHFSHSQIII